MPDFLSAVCAFFLWDPVTEAEPPGWDRHPPDRYRLNGDPDLEYVHDKDGHVVPIGKHLKVKHSFTPYDDREESSCPTAPA